jgi:ABC-2 type transport system ATP-binding protein
MFSIQTKLLTKSYKTFLKDNSLFNSIFKRKFNVKYALKEFDLEIKHQELVGLLGPNGAGKTTLMKMLTGIIEPSSGEATVLGYTPSKREVEFCKSIALVLGNKSQLWWDLPAIDSFNLLQKYYEISNQNYKNRLELLSNSLKVENLLKRSIRTLSLGERMKMELMACLLHDPKIIFLDEPTIGLDVDAQINIRNFLLEYHKNNSCTIIITSHYMADIEALCDKIIFVSEGKKHFDGSIFDFSKLLGDYKALRFFFKCPINSNDIFWTNLSSIFSNDAKSVDILVPLDQIGNITTKILNSYPVIDFQAEKLPIERVVSKLIRDPQLMA